MKSNTALIPALVLLAFVSVTVAGEMRLSSTRTNPTPNTNTSVLKSNWFNTKVTIYRMWTGPYELNAKQAVFTEINGPYTNDVVVTAFVDPYTHLAWLGSALLGPPEAADSQFYLESDQLGVFSGTACFPAIYLGAGLTRRLNVADGKIADAEIHWSASLVRRVNLGEDVDTLITQFQERGGLAWIGKTLEFDHCSVIQKGLSGIDHGLNPWYFVEQRQGSKFEFASVKPVSAFASQVCLEFRGPDGDHPDGSHGAYTARVWIDLKTWNVLRVRPGQIDPADENTLPWGDSVAGFQLAALVDATNGLIHCRVRNATTNTLAFPSFDFGYHEFAHLEVWLTNKWVPLSPFFFPQGDTVFANHPYTSDKIEAGRVILTPFNLDTGLNDLLQIMARGCLLDPPPDMDWYGSHLTQGIQKHYEQTADLCWNDTFAMDFVASNPFAFTGLTNQAAITARVVQKFRLHKGDDFLTLCSPVFTMPEFHFDSSLFDTLNRENAEHLKNCQKQ